jgi:hypothetical protein
VFSDQDGLIYTGGPPNRASEPIVRAVIIVSGQTLELKHLRPTEVASRRYRITSDGHYNVDIAFESGKHIRKDVGDVTPGADIRYEIVVTDSDMSITGDVPK